MNLTTEARLFLRSTRSAILSTFSSKFAGYPFGSVAPFVLDQQAQPIILISSIAEHTKNIIANPKVSLLVFSGAEDLQANARLTLLGEAIKIDKQDSQLRERYLRYFPEAAGYFEMHDFSFYRIQVSQCRYIAGFGKMGWAEGSELAVPDNSLAEQEAGIVEHMNADHKHSMIAYCQHYYDITPTDVEMLGIDCDGFDIKTKFADESTRTLRFQTEQIMTDAQSARVELVKMSKVAMPDGMAE
jgi:heme iron utilization protein